VTYDELGRILSRQINGTANAVSQAFDALHRLTSQTNLLGTFGFTYDGVTSRPQTVTYPAPNGQTTAFDYLDNLGDRRLKEIHHKRAGGATLSRFNYVTAATALVTNWTQQADAGAATMYGYGYDPVDQLTNATLKTTGPAPSILKSYGYAYDKGGNRTTEAIDSSVITAVHNNLNRLSSQQVGGTLRFAGSVNEPAAVTVAGQAAVVDAANQFTGSASVSSGSNTVGVTATDPSGNIRTNTYQVTVAGSSGSFTQDANGNLTSDGVRTYEWDAENRLVAVNQGALRSEFTYNAANQRVRIVEKDGTTVLSDSRYLWCGLSLCDERDATGTTVTRRFFAQGMQEGSSAYFYTRDHLGSIREMTDTSGAVRARYDYDPFGRRTKVSGDKDAAFGYTGHFMHATSGLTLAPYRAYSAALGRWISEDPLGLRAGDLNLYRYVANTPPNAVDPSGMFAIVFAPAAVEAAMWLTAAAAAAAAAWWIQQNPPITILPPMPPLPPLTPPSPPATPGAPAIPTTPGPVPVPVPMTPPTPFPPPPPTTPTIEVPSGPPMCPPPGPGIDCDAMLDNCNSMCTVFKTFIQRAICRAGCLARIIHENGPKQKPPCGMRRLDKVPNPHWRLLLERR